jgi:DNA-binding MarR family transcriptional regulator
MRSRHNDTESLDAVTDAVLLASRVLASVAARSIADVGGDLTLPQYRALAILSSRRPQTMADLAAALNVDPSTASRLCDRLVRKRLIHREPSPLSRRQVEVSISDRGAAIVDAVTKRRRRVLAGILRSVPAAERSTLVASLQAFGAAAGEVPEQAWSLGWSR